MSHHSQESPEEFRKWAEEFALGATKQFPQGKLNEHDEGEIKFAVGTQGKKVVLNFGKPVSWMGMSADEALTLANTLIKHASSLRN